MEQGEKESDVSNQLGSSPVVLDDHHQPQGASPGCGEFQPGLAPCGSFAMRINTDGGEPPVKTALGSMRLENYHPRPF